MSEPRGHHRILLGMAAGVGTFRMLQEGHAEHVHGRDVVVGFVETHGRGDTASLLSGFEVLPRRRVVYRDIALDEMDLPAIRRRGPEVCLIDELAHTNAPGVEHRKRYEDIEDVLDAGVNVISTLNVQHLDSLTDRIAELTGITVRETVPDLVLSSADEVVLIDVPPETLLDRLRAGKVYPPTRLNEALNNFFRIETLAALREITLRQLAQEAEAKRGSLPSRAACPSGCSRDARIPGSTDSSIGWRWSRAALMSRPSPSTRHSCASPDTRARRLSTSARFTPMSPRQSTTATGR
jgi:two-component system sensor histidine kinase KdpD